MQHHQLKTPIKLIALPLLLTLTSYANAATNDCDSKRSKIEQQIIIAKADENSNQIAGLERALNSLKQNCTVDDLIATAQAKISQKQTKIAQQQFEVNQAELALTNALADNDEKKISKYEERVDGKQQELDELQDELESLQIELDALKGEMF